jgi:hypothetical protein
VAFGALAIAVFARRTVPSLVLVAGSLVCVAAAGVRVASGSAGAPRLLKAAMLLAMAGAALDSALGAA